MRGRARLLRTLAVAIVPVSNSVMVDYSRGKIHAAAVTRWSCGTGMWQAPKRRVPARRMMHERPLRARSGAASVLFEQPKNRCRGSARRLFGSSTDDRYRIRCSTS